MAFPTFKIGNHTPGVKYGKIINHTIGKWVLMTVDAKGALIVKKGSWRVNWRLWKPRYYVPRGGKFPKGIPQYVKDAVKEAYNYVE